MSEWANGERRIQITHKPTTLHWVYAPILPSDTMTIDKAPLYDYGLTIKSFLDNNLHKSSLLKRTISQKSSSAFYVVTLSNRGVGGTLHTGLSIQEQNLFYRINDKEIPCGKINFRKIMLQK
jgi:hypothetical protein